MKYHMLLIMRPDMKMNGFVTSIICDGVVSEIFLKAQTVRMRERFLYANHHYMTDILLRRTR